jgi:2-phosphosulfolactate phosphatase
MLKRIDVAVLPAEANLIEADAFVVVDVLRATTTIATLFARGLDDLLVVDEIGAAREAAKRHGRLLFGEVGGLRPEGFDFGNSPLEAREAEVAGRGAVLFTTNGTTALCALGERGVVYAGAPANASALARQLLRYERVAVVCAGTEGAQRFALEDFAAAGLIVEALRVEAPGIGRGDAATLAPAAPARKPGPEGDGPGVPTTGSWRQLILSSEHAAKLRDLGLEADIVFCAESDTSDAVPVVAACGQGWALLRDAAR